MADIIRSLAVEQRKRLVASLMSYAEQSPWWGKLSSIEQREFRKKVLDSVGTYHDFILDIVKVTSEDSLVNEQAIGLIQQVHAGQARLERALGAR